MSNLLVCNYCNEEYDINESKQLDQNNDGFWCDHCDYFTYFNSQKERPQLFLFLEENQGSNQPAKKKIKLNKRLSPLRYPGGKSKIAEQLYDVMRTDQLHTLVSVYAGGASVELAMLDANKTQKIILNEIDKGIYSLYYMIKNYPDILIQKIQENIPNHDDFFKYRDVIKSGYKNKSEEDSAFAALIVNRLAYSGIYNANPLGGRKGSQSQLLSRFNQDDICKRIKKIHSMSDRIIVSNDDAIKCIDKYAILENHTLFLDPPYYEKGYALYRHFYTDDDHINVRNSVVLLNQSLPAADIIITYDNHNFIKRLYQPYTDPVILKRHFSV